MLTVATAIGGVIGAALLVVLLVVTFVAWLARASERAYRTPPAKQSHAGVKLSKAQSRPQGPRAGISIRDPPSPIDANQRVHPLR